MGAWVGVGVGGVLDVRRWILIWAQAFLISGGGIWRRKKSLMVLEASWNWGFAWGAMDRR